MQPLGTSKQWHIYIHQECTSRLPARHGCVGIVDQGREASKAMAVAAAERAVRCLGRGFDMTCDMRLKYCKDAGGCLVERGGAGETVPLAVPGVGVVGGVPADVKCGKGDRVRLKSGVLEFNKMSELFNQRSSVEGKIPSGLFNASFDLDSGSWAQDTSATKCLAMDGHFISLFDLRLDRRRLALAGHVLADVPTAWDPSAIASNPAATAAMARSSRP